MKIDKKEIVRLARSLMFDLDEAAVDTIHENSAGFLNHVERVLNIDVEGVESQFYPHETIQTYLREDEPDHVITYEEAFKNAPKVEGDFFEIVQVVEK